MRPGLLVLSTFLTWAASASSVTAAEFDLYFLGGQSNMEGFGTNSDLSDEDKVPVKNAFIYHSTARPDQSTLDGLGVWEELRPGHGTGFSSDGKANSLSTRFGCELSFARKLLQLKPDRKIAIIKYARNGSSIDERAASQWGCWEPDFEAMTGENRGVNQYDQFLATIRNATSVNDIDGDGVKDILHPAGIIWMQGESDASTEEVSKTYQSNLKRLVDLFRAALYADDLPVVIGPISDSKKGEKEPTWKYGDNVREAQATFVNNDRYAKLVVSTDDYKYSDPWHYDSNGYLDLGRQFAIAIASIPRLPLGSMFEEGASLEVVVADGEGGEGPAWDSEWGILSSGNGNIHRFSRNHESTIFRKDAGTNGLLFDREGRLLACEPKQRRVTRTERDGRMVVLTEKFDGSRYNTPNDLTLDSQGRIFFSDPRYGDRDDMQIRDEAGRTIEGVYRIDVDGKVSRVLGREVQRANGVLVSSDGKFLFVADNNNNEIDGARKLWRFDLNEDGSIDSSSQRLLFDWGRGRGPDGLKQDVDGNLYVAAGLNKNNPPFESDWTVKAGIYVISTDGTLLDFLAVPTDEVTNCAFGGEDRRTLYITGGGTLYSIRTKTVGYTPNP